MKKGVVLKGILTVLFVFAAGIFYMCVTKGEGKEDSVLIRQGQMEDVSDSAGHSAAGEPDADGDITGFAGGDSGAKGDSLRSDKEAPGMDGDTSASGQNAPGAGIEEKFLYVHVCGAVKEPGVYALADGARVADAILCAGDFAPDAAKDYLNLAKPVLDGQKIYVPDEAEVAQLKETGGEVPFYGAETKPSESESTQEAPKASSCVNINTAQQSELMTLPGIGKAKADAIVAYRKEHGAFSSCEELMQVPGIKESIYEKLRDDITVGR
ncbi:MAG: ComEA family DNA-binding protein [Lachnospiraceae bacterium]|nr:ComEA family DNA-binding protein [Lachnospiraceae bacterium]